MQFFKHLADALKYAAQMLQVNMAALPILAAQPQSGDWIVLNAGEANHLYRLHNTPGAVPICRLSDWTIEVALLADPFDQLEQTLIGYAAASVQDYRVLTPANFMQVPIPNPPKTQDGPPCNEPLNVHPLGDGSTICEHCYRHELPERELPETGWIHGKCSRCGAEEVRK
jgi:hypothetical protein